MQQFIRVELKSFVTSLILLINLIRLFWAKSPVIRSTSTLLATIPSVITPAEYKKIFSLSFTDNLKKQVRENMEKEMQEMKKSLFQNETSLLSNILKLSSDDKAPVVIKPIFKAL